MAQSIVQVRSLTKTYTEGDQQSAKSRQILANIDLDIREGEFFVILGKSGSGKSTLLNLLSGIDKPNEGTSPQIKIGETDIAQLNETRQTLFRRDNIGIIFQFFNLIPTLTIVENVTMPLELRGTSKHDSEKLAYAMLERVGLGNRGRDFPDKLSGGEQQRVAIARALVHEPLLVLADEPTGNLDEDNGRVVLSLLLELTRDVGKTLVMATHSPEIVPYADRVCRIQDGGLVITEQTRAILTS
jgi:putative ABC transport system ATP-binding protein